MMKSDDPIKQYEPLWGHWIIESLIGEGSYGRVYRAVRTDQGGRYYSAVKHISIPKSQREIDDARRMGMSTADMYRYFDRTVTRILREIGIMHELRGNTNIVAYEDHEILHNDGETKWEVFIRMELLEPLPAYLERQALSPADVCRLGMELCSALEICARRGIIHRDVKEGNVFVTRDGTFKLGDFGIARELSEQSRSGMSFSGTPSYLAPEVYKREKYDATVDIYSLGILLYKLLNNGRYPFYPPYPAPIAMENAEEAFSRRLKGEQIPAPANGGRKLQATVLKACAYRPQSRFQTAEQLRTALQTASASAQTAPMRLPVAGERTGGRTNSRRSVELPDTEATVALTNQEQQESAGEAKRQLEQKHLLEEKEQARQQREAERIAAEKRKDEQRQRQEAERAAAERRKAALRAEAVQRKAEEKRKRDAERAAARAETARQRAEAREKKEAERQRAAGDRQRIAVFRAEKQASKASDEQAVNSDDLQQEVGDKRRQRRKLIVAALFAAATLVAFSVAVIKLLPIGQKQTAEPEAAIETTTEAISAPMATEQPKSTPVPGDVSSEGAMQIDKFARLIMATGGESGTYFAFGGVIANVLTEKVKNLEIIAITSGASAANCRSLKTGEADLAILQNDVLDYAYNGTEIMKDDGKMDSLRAIATMYSETIQLVALKSSNVNSVADLKGKKVCVGASGSSSEANAVQILSAYRLTYDDINVQHLTFSEAVRAMKNGTADAAFLTSCLPNSAVLELSKKKDIVVVPIDGAERDTLIESYPFYVKSTIPAGTYTDTEAESVAILATLVCTKDLDVKVVYQITKNLFEQKDALALDHAKGKDLDVKKGKDGVSIPFHEGALLYYAKAGLTDNLVVYSPHDADSLDAGISELTVTNDPDTGLRAEDGKVTLTGSVTPGATLKASYDEAASLTFGEPSVASNGSFTVDAAIAEVGAYDVDLVATQAGYNDATVSVIVERPPSEKYTIFLKKCMDLSKTYDKITAGMVSTGNFYATGKVTEIIDTTPYTVYKIELSDGKSVVCVNRSTKGIINESDINEKKQVIGSLKGLYTDGTTPYLWGWFFLNKN